MVYVYLFYLVLKFLERKYFQKLSFLFWKMNNDSNKYLWGRLGHDSEYFGSQWRVVQVPLLRNESSGWSRIWRMFVSTHLKFFPSILQLPVQWKPNLQDSFRLIRLIIYLNILLYLRFYCLAPRKLEDFGWSSGNYSTTNCISPM